MNTIIDYGEDTQLGFASEFQIFFTVAIKTEESFTQSVDETQTNLVGIPLECGGCLDKVMVYLPNRTPLTNDEW